MKTIIEKINFTDYYKSFFTIQGELRERICAKLEISLKTFYNKINADSWSAIEREAIEKIVDQINQENSKIF